MRLFCQLTALLLLLQSCTAAAFDRPHPAKSKPEKRFPKVLEGEWQATERSETFYVDYLAFAETEVTYRMTELSPEAPGTLTLLKDSVELRKLNGDYVFNLAGEGLWLCYILKMPSKDRLDIYGFDEEAKNYVKQYDEESTGEGINFVRYHATDKEWAALLKSPALKKLRSFERSKRPSE